MPAAKYQYYTVLYWHPTPDAQDGYITVKAAISQTDHRRWRKAGGGTISMILGDGQRLELRIGNVLEMAPTSY